MSALSTAAVHTGPEKPILKHVSWSPFGIHDEKASMWFVVVMMSVGVAAG